MILDFGPLLKLGEIADDLHTKYEHMELHEVAALENIGLVFKETESGWEYARAESGDYIILSPLLRGDDLLRKFYLGLAVVKYGKELLG